MLSTAVACLFVLLKTPYMNVSPFIHPTADSQHQFPLGAILGSATGIILINVFHCAHARASLGHIPGQYASLALLDIVILSSKIVDQSTLKTAGYESSCPSH